MSALLSHEGVLFLQRCYASAGFLPATLASLDGDWGPQTEAASHAWDAAYSAIRDHYGPVDPRSEAALHGVLPAVQAAARVFLAACVKSGHVVRIVSGTRTYAEQTALYAQGRTAPGDKVTNAPAGRSLHNFAVAFDVGVFVDGQYLEESPLYAEISALRPSDLEWGGDWRSIKDKPHYQATTGSSSVAVIRRRFEAGKLYIPDTATTCLRAVAGTEVQPHG